MPRGSRRQSNSRDRNLNGHRRKRGRPPIFTKAQRRVLQRLIRTSLKVQIRNLARSL